MRAAPSTTRVIALLAPGYLLLGAAGLLLAIPPGYASPVFPAAGLALAVLLLFGPRAWPGVWIGSIILNASHAALAGRLSGTTVAAAAVIATGATLQALAGRLLVTRWQGQAWREMEREQDAFSFMLLGGVIACAVSATLSVGGLAALGIIDRAEFGFTWWTWYVGDTLGVVVFAPLAFTLLTGESALWRERRRTVGIPMVLALALSALAFGGAARWEAQAEATQLGDDGELVARRIGDRLITQREVLASLRNFIEATPAFTFAQFEQFTRLTLRDNDDVFALSFNDVVALPGRAEFEQQVSRLSPLGPFQITERDAERRLVRASDRPEYVAVRYIVPLVSNQPAVGYDILSEPVRRAAIEQARASGGMTVTAPVRLVQEQKERVGVLALMPVRSTPRGDRGSSPASWASPSRSSRWTSSWRSPPGGTSRPGSSSRSRTPRLRPVATSSTGRAAGTTRSGSPTTRPGGGAPSCGRGSERGGSPWPSPRITGRSIAPGWPGSWGWPDSPSPPSSRCSCWG